MDIRNHPTNPVAGVQAPEGAVRRLTWSQVEIALRAGGIIRPGEETLSIVVGKEGLYLSLVRF